MESRLDRIEKGIEKLFEGIFALRAYQAETSAQMRRTDAKLDRIGKQLGDLGLVQGEVAEDLFFRNLRGVFRKTKMDPFQARFSALRSEESQQSPLDYTTSKRMDFYTIVLRNSQPYWVTLCLENGIVGQGTTKKRAMEKLKEAIDSMEEAKKTDPDIHTSPLSIKELHEFLMVEGLNHAYPVGTYAPPLPVLGAGCSRSEQCE